MYIPTASMNYQPNLKAMSDYYQNVFQIEKMLLMCHKKKIINVILWLTTITTTSTKMVSTMSSVLHLFIHEQIKKHLKIH